MTRRVALAGCAAGALGAYQWLVRPYCNALGTTAEERRAAWPGGDLLPGGRRGATMATTIAAPPAEVWPWLAQLGCDRAGFYSWDRLDNGGHPSAERINPEWQVLAAGDRIASVPGGRSWFDVAAVEPERTLVLRTSLTLPDARCFDPAAETPPAFVDSTWAFHLTPTAAGGTRLVVTTASRGRPRRLLRIVDWLFWEPAHWIMQSRQFAGLRRRATVRQ
jgi:hypothetical protein